MQILWKNHPSDPSQNGTSQHVAREFAVVAIGYGQAEVVAQPRRGTNAYLAMRAEEEARRPANPMDTKVANVYPATWEVISLPRTNLPAVLFRSGSEVTRWESLEYYDNDGNAHDALPSSCPASIRKHFEELAANSDPDQIAAINERALQQRIRNEQHEKSRASKMLGRLGLK